MFPAFVESGEQASSGRFFVNPNLFAPEPVRERIRREVEAEFAALIQQSTGFRRWWLIHKREREISRRLGQVIYAAGAAVSIAAPRGPSC